VCALKRKPVGQKTRVVVHYPREFHDFIEDTEYDVHFSKQRKAVVVVTPQAVVEYRFPPSWQDQSLGDGSAKPTEK
jgi:hypothetical protein